MKIIPMMLLIFVVSIGLGITIPGDSSSLISSGDIVSIPGTDKVCTNTFVLDNYLYCNIDDVEGG